MKMTKKLLTTLLAGLCIFASGCNNTQPEAETPKNDAETAVNVNLTNPVITLNDFESHEELSMLRMGGYLGHVTVNKETEFVTKGQASAKVEVVPRLWYQTGTRVASLTQLMKINSKGLDYTDFAKALRVSVDVYNSQEREIDFGVQLVCNSSVSEAVQYFKLAPKAWTKVEYDITPEFIQQTTINDKINGKYKKTQVQKVSFVFSEPADGTETYYLDNFRLYRSEDSVVPETIELKEHEICSFDEYWEFKKTLATCGDMTHTPTLSWLKLAGQEDRGGILKFQMKPHTASGRVYPGMTFPKEIFGLKFGKEDPKEGQEDWWIYDDNDVMIFDLYIPENSTLVNASITPWYDGQLIHRIQLNLKEKYAWYQGVSPTDPSERNNAGTNIPVLGRIDFVRLDENDHWYRVEIPISQLNQRAGDGHYPTEKYLNETTGEYELREMTDSEKFKYSVRNMSNLTLSVFSENGTAATAQFFYLDNLHFEKRD